MKLDLCWRFWVPRNVWSKKGQKMTIFRGGDIKWRMRATSGSCGLNFFSSAKSSSVTLTAGEMGFALAFLGSEKWVVKKGLKNGVLGTLRCRQIGRRGLNRKTVMIDRFLVPNYPPVQIFSEKYDKMSQGTLWVFCTNINNKVRYCSELDLINPKGRIESLYLKTYFISIL